MAERKDRLDVAILFGGRSGEHEISVRSAHSVFEALDRKRYRVTLIGIDRAGTWRLIEERDFECTTDASQLEISRNNPSVTVLPQPNQGQLLAVAGSTFPYRKIDVVFPVLHGTMGEDGTIQGVLELAEIPYVGAGVLGSAVGMDKDVQKRLLRAAGLPVVPFTAATQSEWQRDPAAVRRGAAESGFPVFVKPANLGSSVGISKVSLPEELDRAIEIAFEYDTKIVLERGVDAREIECAVLGNEEPIVSIPGEIRPRGGFYSYEAKYLEKDAAELLIPAPLDEKDIRTVQTLAKQTFQVLECAGMARVDCFLERPTGQFYINEINTIPGFTSISMYPKLWEHSGLTYPSLLTKLIDLALERHARKSRLRRDYSAAASKAAAARKASE